MNLAARITVGVLAASLAAAPGCPSRPRSPHDIGRAFRVTRDSAGVRHVQELRRGRLPVFQPVSRQPWPVSPDPREKLHPAFDSLLVRVPADTQVTVIVTLQDTIILPPFPNPDTQKPHTAAFNLGVRHRTDSLIAAIAGMRATHYAADSADIAMHAEPVFRSRFWLIQGYVLDVKLKRVLDLAASPRVVYVRPRFAGERPPGPNSITDDDIIAVAKMIGAPGLSAAGYTGSWLGVLDTGIYSDHELLKTPLAKSASAGGKLYNCYDSCPEGCETDYTLCTDCPEGNTEDPCNDGHGTSTGAIVMGDGSVHAEFTGLTGATVDWFDVYKEEGCDKDCSKDKGAEELDACAAVRGFEMAVRRGLPVVVAEIQAEGDWRDPIDRAAARAFEAGTAVIAADGNGSSTAGDVCGPARDALVIGVGARDIEAWLTTASGPGQRIGPVDGRMKPDILGPSSVETAARCATDDYTTFGYTSAATAYAGGTASLLQSWLTGITTWHPGHLYAQVILAGTLNGSFTDATSGAGLLHVPGPNPPHWVGSEALTNKGVITRDLDVGGAPAVSLAGALWWPQPAGSAHARIRLELLDPGGAVRATSDDATSIFQRTSTSLAGMIACPLKMRLIFRWVRLWLWDIAIPILVFERQCWKIRLSDPYGTIPTGGVQNVFWAAAVQ